MGHKGCGGGGSGRECERGHVGYKVFLTPFLTCFVLRLVTEKKEVQIGLEER